MNLSSVDKKVYTAIENEKRRQTENINLIASENYASTAVMEAQGSVFTNTTIINDMLNLLPSHIWKNPNLKWLDPCCGIGNYFIVVYDRLMKNLPIKNIDDRRKHILENMLYFIVK